MQKKKKKKNKKKKKMKKKKKRVYQHKGLKIKILYKKLLWRNSIPPRL